MILKLKDILVEQEGLKPKDKICPYLSKYAVCEKPMSKDVEFQSFTVICVGNACGKFPSCDPTTAMLFPGKGS